MTKNTHLIVIGFLCFSILLNAQTEKGNWIIGGNSSLSLVSNKINIETENQDIDGGTILNVSFSPAAGYFVIDNLAIGLEFPVSYEKSSIEDFDEVETENSTFTFVPSLFARYYFSSSNIRPFLQGGIGAGGSKTKIDSEFGNSESKSGIFQYNFSGGIAIFLNSLVSLDLGVGYVNSTSKPEDSNLKFKNSAIGLNVGFNFFLINNSSND